MIHVLKFGGTSVADPESIRRVSRIVSDSKANRVVVVVSALGGVTDMILKMARLASDQDKGYKQICELIEQRHLDAIKDLMPITEQSAVLSHIKAELNSMDTLAEGAYLTGELTPKLSDKIVGFGELLSSYIITSFFRTVNLDATRKDSRDVIITDNIHGKANVDFAKTRSAIQSYFKDTSDRILVFPGFVATSKEGETTTLGRGGSDYTAAILAEALNADELQIWTDVSGMFTANPKLVKQARSIDRISYEEAMELSHFGAKVLYPPTIQPVLGKGIPIRIKNTFKPEDPGTLITKRNPEDGKTVRGISYIPDISLLSLEGPGMIGIPGTSKRFFEVLSNSDISVVLITQASSEHSICIGVATTDAQRAEQELNKAFAYEISLGQLKPIIKESGLAIIALVGDNMKSHQGLSGKMFSALGKNNVNIRAIAQGASERNISAVIKEDDVRKALNTLHEAFFEEQVKQLNLFVIGVGNVGARFLRQIQQQRSYLKKQLKLNVRVIGITNSRKMHFDGSGIDLDQWEEKLANGKKSSLNDFYQRVLDYNYRNSILVDNTASTEVSDLYPSFLKKSIAVVTCNKIACSGDHKKFLELQDLSREYNAPFLFETNVGAGLPVIDTLRLLIASGDKVHKIEAVLSGSLNFIFNNFNSETTFHDVVKRAQEEGFTEPDPLIDLSGIDVMRKILILARVSGFAMEIGDIENRSFLPEESLNANSIDTFYSSLKKHEDGFQEMLKKATQKNCRLKYVARFENGKSEVGLQEIPEGHDFYNLRGSDNILLFYTQRYPDQPLIIKGAGAGADVTASGIFADIIRIGNF